MTEAVNTWEARARAVKAAKIARVLRRMLDEPGVTLDALASADDAVRERVAVVAKVRPPSGATWAAAIGILEAGER